MKKQLLQLVLMVLLPIVANAYNVQIDGIYYNLNKTARTAEVTYMSAESNQSAYADYIKIPTNFSYQGYTYSVTTIGEFAFWNCYNLESVDIPSSVTTIGKYAFENCTKLKTMYIPNSVTSIGEGAFYGCNQLTSVNIPNSVISIGENAFYNCI